MTSTITSTSPVATTPELPIIIQGGMGIAVSGWRLANTVSRLGQMGVVSGVAIDTVVTRTLQLGDPGGHIRRALAAYPYAEAADKVQDRFFIEGGKQPDEPFKNSSMKRAKPSRQTEDLMIISNFVEVWLAKEGHDGLVGINYLEKVQSTTLASLYGAMLADVDFVLMGAGIPKLIPAILDDLAAGSKTQMKLDVKGSTRSHYAHFDPEVVSGEANLSVKRPKFLAIISSHVLAIMLGKKIDIPVDGFIIEGPSAGGHNAPPRGKMSLNDEGEPIYGPRDVPDLEVIAELGLPFWLAGGYSHAEQVKKALAAGATGVQIGTPFAFCEESGFTPEIKAEVVALNRTGEAKVFTDPIASPSGFPFKVVQLEGTASQQGVYEERERSCTLGYLRHAYEREDGKMAWRCPAEPVDAYLKKSGTLAETEGRKCLCQALMSNVGLVQLQPSGKAEPILVTSGDAASEIARFLKPGADSYTAADVIAELLPG